MFKSFAAHRAISRHLKEVSADRDYWKKRAETLEAKLDTRSDFFIERENRLIDRFLTAKVKTYAITDEAKAQTRLNTPAFTDANDYADKEQEYLDDRMADLVQWAKDAGHVDPETEAQKHFGAMKDSYIAQFRQEY